MTLLDIFRRYQQRNQHEEPAVLISTPDEGKQEIVTGKRKIFELLKRFVRRMAAVSDQHLLSQVAMCPPGLTNELGVEFNRHAGQIQLWNYWEDFNDKCDELEVDTVFVVGDVIHGQNPIERGVGLMSTNLDVQISAGVLAMQRICKDRKSLWISGSKYHISAIGHNSEKDVCDRLGGTWLGQVANIKIDPTEKIINVSHGGSGAFVYRETAMGREILFAKVAEANGKLPKISMFIHGHWHWFSYLHQSDTHFLQLPCWTAYEPVPIFTKNYTRFQPDIGAAIIMVDDEGRITCWHYLYPLPHIVDQVRVE